MTRDVSKIGEWSIVVCPDWFGLLIAYLNSAMTHARYELLDDGTYYGEIEECPGVWANEPHLEACRTELFSVLEDWVLVRLAENLPLSVIDGVEPNV